MLMVCKEKKQLKIPQSIFYKMIALSLPSISMIRNAYSFKNLQGVDQ